jgi:hypothetical protein
MLIPHPLKKLQKTQNAKKVISKKCVKFSAYSFFHQLFCFFFHWISTQHRILRFMIPVDFVAKKIVLSILALFANLNPNCLW